MALFRDVAPGEPWRAEPAERYNRVNALLAKLDANQAGDVPATAPQRGALVVYGAPSGGMIFSAYRAVLLGATPIKANPIDPADAIFRIDNAAMTVPAGQVWGVTQNYGKTGQTIPVLLQGLTPISAAGAITAGDPLVPYSGGVVSGEGGNARALTTAASGGIVLAQLGAGGAAVAYSGYFTLSVAGSTASTITVGIADGATGSNSIAVVNGGTTYSLPPYTATVSGETVFCLAYTPAQYNSGGALVSSATMAISSVPGDTLPSGGTSGAYYMQLGRVVGSSGAELRVVQDHTAGVAYFNWYQNCWVQ